MHYIRKIDEQLARIEKGLAILLFSGLILSILFNIISRNFFNMSFHTILEMSPTLVLWLVLVGSSLCLRDNRHIKLEIILRFAPEKWRSIANAITSVFGMAVMGILLFASCEFVKNEMIIFGAGGLLTIIFPWFFGIACFRFFIGLTGSSHVLKRSL
jgi:TRAP-type C4-dicarboxylate transport system permease small subunit